MTLSVNTRLVHNLRGSGTVKSLIEFEDQPKRMIILFDDSKSGIFDQESENFVYEHTGEPMKAPVNYIPKSHRQRLQEASGYLPYESNKQFFKSHNFVKSVDENPEACWWFFGFLDSCGRPKYHPPKKKGDLDVDQLGTQPRGATVHNYYPDPGWPGLDKLVGEFFDTYRTGFIQINSVHLFKFVESTTEVPSEFTSHFEAGRDAGLAARKRDDTCLQ